MRPIKQDWSHPDDYAPEGVQWAEMRMPGDYQLQVSVHAHEGRVIYRHRYENGPWMKGKPNVEK